MHKLAAHLALLLALPLVACSTAPPSTAEAPPQASQTTFTPAQPFFPREPRWRPIFQGIDHAELATDTPRYLVVQALRIDTSAEGLELSTTPGNAEAPLDTNGQTTRAFLEEHGLSVAINTHFFSPCCNRVAGEAKDLIGLSIAQGEMVSPHTDTGQRDLFIFEAGLYDDSSMDVVMLPEDSLEQIASFTPTHAIAGRAVLLNGESQDGRDDFSASRHPRTLVGLSDDHNTLYLVTIDGRQPAFSTGASLSEAAAIMSYLGASDAINVDGGGSTTMVLRDPDGASQLLNSPSGGNERVVGSNLGLRARALPERFHMESSQVR